MHKDQPNRKKNPLKKAVMIWTQWHIQLKLFICTPVYGDITKLDLCLVLYIQINYDCATLNVINKYSLR